MSITITLVVKSVLQDSSKTVIEDTTTYTAPARSSFSSVFYAFKVDENEVATARTVTTQGVLTTASEWEVATPEDGYFNFQLLLYWIWESGTAFVTDDVVIHSGIYYKALQNGTNKNPATETTYWAVHTASVDDTTEQLVESGELNCILFGRIKAAFARETAEAARVACACDDDKKPSRIQRYERLGVLVDGIAVDNYQLRFGEGEKKVLYTTKIIVDS